MKLLVAATLRSGPACSGSACVAAAASGEAASFTKATVVAPPARSCCSGSTRSGLRPDCENASATSRSAGRGARYSVSSDGGSEVTSRPSRAITR